MRRLLFLFLFFLIACFSFGELRAQSEKESYWQQEVAYQIEASLDVHTNKLTGKEQIVYTNNSPDTLDRVFFHLYWNAFQPGSMMDRRSRELGKIILGITPRGDTVRDWDGRVRDRIAHLQKDEIGYDSVVSVYRDGQKQGMIYHETILEIRLDKPVLPRSRATFDLVFKAQVPLQIRRSGRDNAEGVRYSMSQWYPKIAEYDKQGWHPTPYVAREFYGVWGDYKVSLTLDSSYYVGATGYLLGSAELTGADSTALTGAGSTKTWHFYAPKVHDFVWAADPDYIDISAQAGNEAGTVIHVIYKENPRQEEAWQNLLKAAVRVLPFMEKHFGPYPYKKYTFIQGGDGGMEYPMATLVKSPSLGTAFHEWMHSWYQMMLGTNETQYPWMDEGFTTYAEGKISAYYYRTFADSVFKTEEAKQKTLAGYEELPDAEAGSYRGYFNLVRSGLAEPMTTFSDHYETNYAYGQNAYSKGAVFMEQLGYIVGQKNLDKTLLEYYHKWRFKHPGPDDFIRIAEKVSGLKLDWYQEYWINTIKVIDYGIEEVKDNSSGLIIKLNKWGAMPMPLDLELTFKDGRKQIVYIPNYLMFGGKPNEFPEVPRFIFPSWPFTDPAYELLLPFLKKEELKSIEIDPSQRMADVDRSNNKMIF